METEKVFKKFFKELKKEQQKDLKKVVKLFSSSDDEDVRVAQMLLETNLSKRYKNLPLAKRKKEYLEIVKKKHLKKYQEKLVYLTNLLQAGEFKEFTITVEWKKSRVWGYNPKATTFISGLGHIDSGSVSGCGYDKLSTAVANVLNKIPFVTKILYLKSEKRGIKSLRDYLGYGSGYDYKPYFDGGVGVSCYERIFDKLGLRFKQTAYGKTFDVFTITKK